MEKIRIMLVDDQMLLREGLKTIINLQEDMEVVAEAEHGKMAIEQMEKKIVDVILMDICMPVLNGVEACAVIKEEFPETSIIILTTFDNDDYIIDALTNGAAGYILKDIDASHLIMSIRDAHRGQMMLPGRIAAKLAARLSKQKSSFKTRQGVDIHKEPLFSDREKEIGLLLAQGLSNRQIAKELFLSEGTVKNYISDIYAKLGTNNRTKAGLLIQQLDDE
ncbi:response regulator [Candidatus Contubernalis alkaliaceticus]|uniref:response regulator n=1 Tax=Candidatus Contubernalis alkaliaceticus TaxID=338645 RepID=UPI001F4BE0C0|nr:response regulator transcription factor [Candidatus Contubernalis alkalaceticus]UNC92193.1 response regulator transcription factor [Candidatus Contubernalis alkalaceticus]